MHRDENMSNTIITEREKEKRSLWDRKRYFAPVLINQGKQIAGWHVHYEMEAEGPAPGAKFAERLFTATHGSRKSFNNRE